MAASSEQDVPASVQLLQKPQIATFFNLLLRCYRRSAPHKPDHVQCHRLRIRRASLTFTQFPKRLVSYSSVVMNALEPMADGDNNDFQRRRSSDTRRSLPNLILRQG